MNQPITVNALPDQSTLSLRSPERALGRLAEIALHSPPEGGGARDLAGDIFYEMYLSQPKPLDSPPVGREVNRTLLDWAKGTHGWETSRASTTANMPAAMTAASFMWSHLTSDETMQEALQKQEEAAEAAQQAAAQQAAANMLRQMAQGDDDLEKQAASAQAQADAARQKATDTAAQAQQLVEDLKDKPLAQAGMAAAAKRAGDEAKEVAEAAAGWGQGAGSAIQSDPAAAMAFLKKNKGRLSQIAKLAGRLRGFALQARRERTPRGVTPVSAGLTRDFSQLFPTELALLRPDAPPTLRAQKMAEWAEGGLLGYQLGADGDKRGPFVAAVDVSPSMRMGAREVVAKGVALGVAQTARQDGRKYSLFTFASDPDLMRSCASSDDWNAHADWASDSQGGGTDFDMAITAVIDHLRALNVTGADALFISDGEAGVSRRTAEAWREFAAETGARLFYVPVGRGGLVDIELLADRVIELAELDEAAGQQVATAVGGWL